MTGEKMKGFFNSLTPKQQDAALAYDGPENFGFPMTGEKDPRDVMQAEHDARLSEHPAFQAPAEMPAIYRIADEFERELFAWRNLPSRDGAALRACAYALAQKAETLFAPILAENASLRETLRSNSVWDFPRDIQNLTVKLDAAEARALAAEAALAAEKERADMAVRQMIRQNDRLAAIRAQE